MHFYVHCSITSNSQDMDGNSLDIHQQVDRRGRCGMCTYITSDYSAIKKNKTLPLVTTWIDLEGMQSEINQTKTNTI